MNTSNIPIPQDPFPHMSQRTFNGTPDTRFFAESDTEIIVYDYVYFDVDRVTAKNDVRWAKWVGDGQGLMFINDETWNMYQTGHDDPALTYALDVRINGEDVALTAPSIPAMIHLVCNLNARIG